MRFLATTLTLVDVALSVVVAWGVSIVVSEFVDVGDGSAFVIAATAATLAAWLAWALGARRRGQDPRDRAAWALFIAAALFVAAIGVIAVVLMVVVPRG